eukprot:gene5772-biopygen17767
MWTLVRSGWARSVLVARWSGSGRAVAQVRSHPSGRPSTKNRSRELFWGYTFVVEPACSCCNVRHATPGGRRRVVGALRRREGLECGGAGCAVPRAAGTTGQARATPAPPNAKSGLRSRARRSRALPRIGPAARAEAGREARRRAQNTRDAQAAAQRAAAAGVHHAPERDPVLWLH